MLLCYLPEKKLNYYGKINCRLERVISKMLVLNNQNLTSLEKKMYEKLTKEVKDNYDMRIVEAANLCNVSNSKVSKFVRKIGFKNFKEFKKYFSGKELNTTYTTEFKRLTRFFETFDREYVDKFVNIIHDYDKIVVFGLGPSYIIAQYFSYKLSVFTDKNVSYTQVEDYAYQLADKNTLLVVISVTGKFSTFDKLFSMVKERGAKSLLLLEEYVNDYEYGADYLYQLTRYKQDDSLQAFEKTRTILLIFLEEVLSQIREELDG